MPARKKWRRKINVQGVRFLWYVREDADGMGPELHLFTPDKSLVVYYMLNCERSYPSNPALVVVQKGIGKVIRDAPDWERRSVATPRFVAEVATWVLDWHRRKNDQQ